MGRDKTNAKIYSKNQAHFVKFSFSEALILRTSITIKPNKANIPIITQKGINLGYRSVLSNEIAIEKLNKFKRHLIPKLKKMAFVNMKKGSMIKVDFFIFPPPFASILYTFTQGESQAIFHIKEKELINSPSYGTFVDSLARFN